MRPIPFLFIIAVAVALGLSLSDVMPNQDEQAVASQLSEFETGIEQVLREATETRARLEMENAARERMKELLFRYGQDVDFDSPRVAASELIHHLRGKENAGLNYCKPLQAHCQSILQRWIALKNRSQQLADETTQTKREYVRSHLEWWGTPSPTGL